MTHPDKLFHINMFSSCSRVLVSQGLNSCSTAVKKKNKPHIQNINSNHQFMLPVFQRAEMSVLYSQINIYNDVLLQEQGALHVDFYFSTGLELKYDSDSPSLCTKAG